MVWAWFVAHMHTPGHSFPLGVRQERFSDLVLFSGKYQIGKDAHLANYSNLNGTLYPRNYPPFAIAIYIFLLQVCAPYAVILFCVAVIGAALAACFMLWERVRKLDSYRWYVGVAIFSTGLFGWGMEQVIMRENIEGLLWIAVCCGAALYSRKKYGGAAVAFALATCIKPFPVLWLGLMARHQKYRAVCLGIFTAIAVSLVSLLAVDRNIVRAYDNIATGGGFFHLYIVAFRPIGEEAGIHSLFASIKMLYRIIHNHGFSFPPIENTLRADDPVARRIYDAYLPLAALIGLLTLWRSWNKPVLNQIFALVCVTLLLPMVSAPYTLSLLLVPMAFFLIYLMEDVAEGRTRMSLGQMLLFVLPFAWIMATKPPLLLNGILTCGALLVLLTASISIPMRSALLDDITPPTI